MRGLILKYIKNYLGKGTADTIKELSAINNDATKRTEGLYNDALKGGIISLAGTNISTLEIISTIQIFWITESAKPGDEIAIQGSFSSTATVGLAINDSANYINALILSQRDGFIKAQLPATLPVGVYQVFIKEGANRSKEKYINQAQGYGFDTPEVYPSAKVSLIGINLYIAGKSPVIKFVSQKDGTIALGVYNITGSDEYKLSFTAPAGLIPGVAYSVYVSNGYGGKVAETIIPASLSCIPASTDTFNLGVAWHARFTNEIIKNEYNVKTNARIAHATGDGVTNDLPAIQAAIDAASKAGGGIVFLPPGNYLCTGASIILKKNVVLHGDETGVTNILYGVGERISRFILFEASSDTAGISNIVFTCKDDIGLFGAARIKGNNFFLKNIKWELKQGDWIEIFSINNFVVLGCEFTQGANSQIHGPMTVNSCQFVSIKTNKFTSVPYQLFTINSKNCFVENNILIRDVITAKIPGSTVHCLITDFISDSIFNGNSIIANGPIPRNPDGSPLHNDGESVICEDSHNYDYDYGIVTSATHSTLNDSTKEWPTTFEKAPSIAIINGKGKGQIRKILSRTSTVLTVTNEWDVIPDTSSSYSIFNMGLERVTYKDNYLVGQQRGFTLYRAGMQRVNIISNHLMNSGSIDITVGQATREKKIFTPVYNINISHNSADASKDQYNGTSIGVQAILHVINYCWGTICYNLKLEDNTLIGSVPNKDVVQEGKFSNSFNNYMIYHADKGHPFLDNGVPFILGTIMSGNTAKNVEKAVHLNTGSYETSIKSTKLINSPQLILDDTVNGASHGSVETISI